MRRLGVLALCLAAGVAPSLAQEETGSYALAGVIDEFRLGLHAYDVHYAALPFMVDEWDIRGIESFSADLLFTSPEALGWLGAPRPELGATINLSGMESLIHAGLTWQLPVFDTPLYLEGSFGAALHDGALQGAPDPHKNFGCRVNFYERFGVGVQASESMTATLTYEHISNNGWCPENDGLSNFGLRIGWKF